MPTILPIEPYILPSYSARYTFSGKERDTESGYSYFGARYYNSAYSIWMSVDPMADKYPNLSPYAYCGNNPGKLVDPDGEEWEKKEDEEYANKLITTARKRQEGLDPEYVIVIKRIIVPSAISALILAIIIFL